MTRRRETPHGDSTERQPRGEDHPMTAPDLTPAQAERLAAIEAAPDAPESLRERVARAICAARSGIPWDAQAGWQQRHYGRMADAALRVITEATR